MQNEPNVQKLASKDYASFSWSRLRRYRNIEWVKGKIILNHGLEKRHYSDARRQAEQISLCIEQAEAFFDSAFESQLIVKPLLYYYGITSLSTALILFLRDGNFRIEKIRENFGSHGLRLSVGHKPRLNLLDALVVSEGKYGIFQLFRETIGGDFVVAEHEIHEIGAISRRFDVVFQENAQVYLSNKLNTDASSLVSIYPDLHINCSRYGCSSALVRFNLKYVTDREGLQSYNITVQPAAHDLFESALEKMIFSASAINDITVTELKSGLIIKIGNINDRSNHFQFPSIYRDMNSSLFLSAKYSPIRQVCVLYILNFVFGMYSRYYPEMWAKDLRDGTERYLACFDLIEITRLMFPLFILQEFESEMYISRDFA